MSDEFSAVPLFTFTTLKNTELGGQTARLGDDGSIVIEGVLKKVTESMLASYPKSQLGKWTPNRAALRFSKEDAAGRNFKRLDNGEALDTESLIALAG